MAMEFEDELTMLDALIEPAKAAAGAAQRPAQRPVPLGREAGVGAPRRPSAGSAPPPAQTTSGAGASQAFATAAQAQTTPGASAVSMIKPQLPTGAMGQFGVTPQGPLPTGFPPSAPLEHTGSAFAKLWEAAKADTETNGLAQQQQLPGFRPAAPVTPFGATPTGFTPGFTPGFPPQPGFTPFGTSSLELQQLQLYLLQLQMQQMQQAQEQLLAAQANQLASQGLFGQMTPARQERHAPPPAAASNDDMSDEMSEGGVDALLQASSQKSLRVQNACANCKRSKTRCDNRRPCSRCIRLKREATCRDSVHKKRGRKRLVKPDAASTPFTEAAQPMSAAQSPTQPPAQ